MDARLLTIAAYVRPCTCIADVGCDHGMLSEYLIKQKIAKRVIATDISAPSLLKTEMLAHREGLDIDVRCGDGLTTVRTGEADSAVIAGMGGREIFSILSDPRRIDGIKDYVVSPQSDIRWFREHLSDLHLKIDAETMVCVKRHDYFIMKLTEGQDKLTELEAEFGRANLNAKSDVFAHYLEKNLRIFKSLSVHPDAKIALEERIRLFESALLFIKE